MPNLKEVGNSTQFFRGKKLQKKHKYDDAFVLYFAKTEILLKVFFKKKTIINPGSMMNGSIAAELKKKY